MCERAVSPCCTELVVQDLFIPNMRPISCARIRPHISTGRDQYLKPKSWIAFHGILRAAAVLRLPLIYCYVVLA